MSWARRYGYGATLAWPLDGPISQDFGPTDFTLAGPMCYRGRCYEHFHDGLDVVAPLGTPVRAMGAGRVDFAGRSPTDSVIVLIDHDPRVASMYGHLQPQLSVGDGQLVAAGQVIGRVGLTGFTTGPHLHLEVHIDGEPVDPLTVLPPRD
jgi:murein DD-endopeptidase MepM/ murein hydrolase activator NlpD